MLTSFFNPDNAFWSTINKLIDLVVLSLLWALCCLPVVTIGPACIALYYAVVKAVRKQRSYSAREFFRAFRVNFKKGLIIWLVLLGLGLMMLGADVPLLLSFLRMEKTADTVCIVLFVCKAALLAGAGCWCLVLQSRYEEKLVKLAETSLYLFLRYLPVTLLQLLILFWAGLLLYAEPLLLCIVPGAAVLLLSFPTEPVLRRLCDRKEAEAPGRDAWFL